MGDFDPAVESRDWKAWQDSTSIHVAGTVVAVATNYVARLSKKVPQGINPKILMLDLTLEQVGDVGGDALTPLRVQYSQLRANTSFDEVTILGCGKGGAQISSIEPVR